MTDRADLVIVGAGAAGLMASIAAGRATPGRSIVVLDGAAKLGAKILISGGGRCNVTHETVSEADFCGSTPMAIRKVLRRFGVEATVAFFRDLGVELVREETGKLFPATSRARTVLDALVGAAGAAGVELRHPCRVETLRAVDGGFEVAGPWGALGARRVILATGGRSVPKTGSDGHGETLARALGHGITPIVVPALVPLRLREGSPLRTLPGITLRARLELRSTTGRRLHDVGGSTLLAHFGLSGPCVLDMSRHWLHAVHADQGAHLVASWLPATTREEADAWLRGSGRRGAASWLAQRLPDRLARALCVEAGVDAAAAPADLPRALRLALLAQLVEMPLAVTGTRGFEVAEATAGGIPLAEMQLQTLESRRCPGLFACGEVLDVDGRLGGFNFQWAWASGHVAGSSA